jgi:hypothetical protein
VLGETEIIEAHLGIVPVIVVDGIHHPAILGCDILGNDSIIDYATGLLTCQGHQYVLHTCYSDASVSSLGQVPPRINGKQIEECVLKNSDVFTAKGERIGLMPPNIAMKILTSGAPIKQRAYCTPLRKRADMERVVKQLLDQGIIQPSTSP